VTDSVWPEFPVLGAHKEWCIQQVDATAETSLQFVGGLRGSLDVTFEEGTCPAWLHDLPMR